MIAQLSGTLLHKSPQYVVVDVGGVGYHVMVSLTSFSQLPDIGAPVTIHTHTHMREDQLALFGFTTLEERMIFQKLISISGVGPKIALTILSGLPAAELAEAISREDALRLCSIPGVGKKTAERIIIELKDKLARDFPPSELPSTTQSSRRLYEDVLSALMNLGYQRPAAEKAMKRVSWQETTTIEAAIRATLKELATP
jgi:Holliday junction DNA helicase RuvA